MGSDRAGLIEKHSMPHQSEPRSWVLLAGGFHRQGGMDRCNRALARYLGNRGDQVHLVCHQAEGELARHKNITLHLVPRPGQSFLLGGLLLARRGQKIAQQIAMRLPATRVVVNGGNCSWPDINWVHCVHHAWQQNAGHGPAWFQLKQRSSHCLSCYHEKIALRRARVVIANSIRTRNDLIDHLAIAPDRIHTIYPGADPEFRPATIAGRAEARRWLAKNERSLLVSFIGALGYDCNKGFDLLFSAWRKLCARSDWDADLIVAGGGRAVDLWRRKIRAAGLEQRVTLLGFTDRISEVLAASDLLVSPVRYESYGLNVQEAFCAGVPAMVSRGAGVAERYPDNLRDLLIDNPEDVDALAQMLLQWRPEMLRWKERLIPFSRALRSYTLEDMARQIVAVVEWGAVELDTPSLTGTSTEGLLNASLLT